MLAWALFCERGYTCTHAEEDYGEEEEATID